MGKVKNKPKKNGKVKDKALPEVMTLPEAARWLRVSEDQLLTAVENRQVPSLRIGEDWRFTQTSLLESFKATHGNGLNGKHPVSEVDSIPAETPEEQAEYWETIMKNRDEMDRISQRGKYATE